MKTVSFSPLLAATLVCSLFIHACQKDSHTVPNADQGQASELSPSERCMCLPPYTISVTATSSNTATIVWDEMPESLGYQVEWLQGSNSTVIDSSMLSSVFTEGNSIMLTELKPDRHYAVRVINVCRLLSSDPPGWVPFKTAPKPTVRPKSEAFR